TGNGASGESRAEGVQRRLSVAQLTADRGRDVHHMRVPLDLHQTIHRHGARPSDPTDVVAPKVDQHHVLGALLEVAQELFLEAYVFLRVGATSPRAGKRPRFDAPPLHLNELLGRRPDHVLVARSTRRPTCTSWPWAATSTWSSFSGDVPTTCLSPPRARKYM